MPLKIVNNNSPGSADIWGGDDHDRLATAINLGEAYTYLIIKSGATYYAKNSVGEIFTSNTNFGTLLSSITTTPNSKIVLGPGDFSITSLLTITTNNITIKGCGVDVTRLTINTPPNYCNRIRVGTTSLGTPYTVTVNALKGQRVITVASTTGIIAGDWVFVTRLVAVDASSATRYDAEFHKVASVTSTTVTVEDNLMEDFSTTEQRPFIKSPGSKTSNSTT